MITAIILSRYGGHTNIRARVSGGSWFGQEVAWTGAPVTVTVRLAVGADYEHVAMFDIPPMAEGQSLRLIDTTMELVPLPDWQRGKE